MSTSSVRRFLIAFAAVVGLALIPISAFAQRSGGGGHSGGGGGGSSHGSAGGSSHGSEGGSYHGGGGYYGGRSYGGGSYGHGDSRGSSAGASRGMTGRSGSESSRSFGSEGTRSSNIRPAIADGQWHSFGNRDVVRTAATSGFVGGARTANFGRSGNFRGGWGGYGWGGRGGWGWGGLGFGFGWPYWGFGWDPWLYSPYWYGPWAYSYYPDYGLDYYGYNWSDDPPPYRPDSYNSKDAPDANLSPNYHLSASSNSNNRELDRN